MRGGYWQQKTTSLKALRRGRRRRGFVAEPARRCFYCCLSCGREVPAVQDVRSVLARLRCTRCGARGFAYCEALVRA